MTLACVSFNYNMFFLKRMICLIFFWINEFTSYKQQIQTACLRLKKYGFKPLLIEAKINVTALQIYFIPLSVTMNRKIKKPLVKLNFRRSKYNNE